ncbi:NACHT domain-containing protein [Streptomyces sp. NPDC059092]|uniref:NACHT domain-containing protein n=1 Tax=Streptomyces sp. NPDC059092 TaxID=3346725 RepID=UPI0036C81C5E
MDHAGKAVVRLRWHRVLVGGSSGVLVAGLGLMCLLKGVAEAANAATVLGSAGVVALLVEWARRRSRTHSTSDQVDEAARALARLVGRQWEEEAVLRQLFDPAPLPVTWSDCSEAGVADHRELVGAPISWCADEPESLAGDFRGLRRRRLVAVGPAGSGKSTFAVLLTLGLLRSPEEGDPVPVLLSLASFDPGREAPAEWLRRRITSDYPALADGEVYGPSVVRDLLADGRILPVLDGLDELPASGHGAVVAALNRAYPAGAPLVLTCRTESYVDAVAETGVLAGAAVVAPAPVCPADAVALLRLAAPPGRGQESWTVLADGLARDPGGPAARALASPLMVALVRSVYADAAPGSRADPAKLTDLSRFPTAAAIEQHLLDRFVPTVYGRASSTEPGARRWDPERARRHLGHLARCLNQQPTPDLAWWRLYDAVPALAATWSRALLWSLPAALSGALRVPRASAAELSDGLTDNKLLLALEFGSIFAITFFVMQCVAAALPGRDTVAAWVTALCGTLTTSVVIFAWYVTVGQGGFAVAARTSLLDTFGGTFAFFVVLLITGPPVPPRSPSRAAFNVRHWRRRLPGAVARAVGVALLFVPVLHIYWLAEGRNPPSAAVVGVSLLIGLSVGTGLAALQWTRSAVTVQDIASPRSSIRDDRRVALAQGVYVALVTSVLAAAVNVLYAASEPPGFATVLGEATRPRYVSLGLFGATLALAASAWPHYLTARLVLAARGGLPWRLQAFLADARRLGVLRQVGPVHQFRHARIQHHLAGVPDLPRPRSRPRPEPSRPESSDSVPAPTDPCAP